MFSLLGALYRGQLNPDETIVSSHPDYRPLNRKIATLREQLKNQLSEPEINTLEELFSLYDRSNGMQMEAAFIQGFKLGAAMELEVLIERDGGVQRTASDRT